MSRFSLKLMFPLLVVLLVFAVGGVFFAATGLVTPLADAAATQAADTSAAGIANQPLPSTDSTGAAAAAPTPEEAQAIAAGNTLFKGNCAQCHALNDVVVGPALAGLHQRRSEQWLIPWIKNSSKVVASGDKYAVKIFNQYQKQQMPSFALSEQEIRQILTYLKAESSSGTTSTAGLALN